MGDPAGGVHYGKGDPGPFLMVDSGGFGGVQGQHSPLCGNGRLGGSPFALVVGGGGCVEEEKVIGTICGARVCAVPGCMLDVHPGINPSPWYGHGRLENQFTHCVSSAWKLDKKLSTICPVNPMRINWMVQLLL